MKKRILYLDNSPSNAGIGGSHKSLYTLIDGLDKTRFAPFLLLNQKSNRFLQMFSSLKIPIYFLDHQLWDTRTNPLKNNINKSSVSQPAHNNTIKSCLGILFWLIRDVIPMTLKTIFIVRKLKIDIIHTNARVGSNQHGVLAGWLTGIPVISHERGWTPNNWLNRNLVKIPKIIICVSNAVKDNMLKVGANNSQCRVIFNGRKLPVLSGELKKYVKSGIKEFIVGIMSTISVHKGQEIFVKGAIELLKRYPNMEFHIYGDTDRADPRYLNYLENMIDTSGFADSIVFKGFVFDVNKIIQEFHLICCMTVGDEPLAGVIIEGFINKTVVLATKTGGSQELIIQEDNGMLIEPGSIDGFSNAVEILYHNPTLMKKLVNNGYSFAVTNLSDEIYVKNVEMVYDSINDSQISD